MDELKKNHNPAPNLLKSQIIFLIFCVFLEEVGGGGVFVFFFKIFENRSFGQLPEWFDLKVLGGTARN